MKRLLILILICSLAIADVTTTHNRNSFACNGATTEFDFTFDVMGGDTSDIIVVLRDSDGDDVTLTETVDYTVSATNDDYRAGPGGTVTTVETYASGYTLVVYRSEDATNSASLRTGSRLNTTALQNEIDKLHLLIQDLQEQLNRCPKFPVADSTALTVDYSNSVARASSYPYFGADGSMTTTDSVASDNTVVSVFMEGVVDDATGLAALTTMGGLHVYNIATYGAVKDDSSDDSTAIQAAIDAAELVNGCVYIPIGEYTLETGLTIDAHITIWGEDEVGSILKKSGDIVGITTSKGCTLYNFTLNSGGGADASNGIDISSATYRTRMKNVTVTNQGADGIELTSSNLGTYEDLTLTSNGTDGLHINGTHDNPNTNAMVLKNIDARSNTGWGINCEDGRENFGIGLTAQNNGNGIRINDRANFFQIYAESNTTTQIELTSEANCKGNYLQVVVGTLTDNSAGDNTVLRAKRGAVFDTNFNKVTTDKVIFENINSEDTAVKGIGQLDHSAGDGTPADREYGFHVSATDADQSFTFANTETDRVLDISMDGDLTVARVFVPGSVTFTDSDTTPAVNAGNAFTTNTTGITITRFDGGVAGQMISIISKGAIVFDTSSASRLTGSSVDITTASGDTTLWICETGGTSSSVWRLLSWIDVSADNS